MKLYYAPGACSLASRISLYEIGAPAEFVRADIRTKQLETGEDFRTISPLGYVPALQLDDGQILLENTAILPFIASLKPGVLAPTGDALREARLHEALGFLSAELHKAFGPFFANPQGEARQAALSKLESRLGFVEQLLSDGRDYWLGAELSVADAYAFDILSWADHFGISYDRYPHIERYVERVGARESVRRAMQDEGLLQSA
jgi:glutathione S-transferase